MSDFFDNAFGQVTSPRRPRVDRLVDAAYDFGLVASGGLARMRAQAEAVPRRRVLVVGVSVPGRLQDMDRVVEHLKHSRHQVTTSIVQMEPKGKFENLTTALDRVGEPASAFDWVLLTDDDIALPDNFTDDFIGLLELTGLVLAQPAHRRLSYASYKVTQRLWGALAHSTGFVEIGPLTAIRGDVIDQLLPFPNSRWAWGLDVMWAQIAHERGWRIGVVDGTPVEHLRPIGGIYDTSAAQEEAKAFLAKHGVTVGRKECFGETRVLAPWGPDLKPFVAPAIARPPHGADAALP